MWLLGRMVVGAIVAFGFSALAVCAGPLTANELNGSWELVQVGSQPVRAPAATALPTFTIKDQTIEGFDGCNNFSGRLDKPGSITSTRRGCPDGAIKLPLDLADPMSHLQAGTVRNGTLSLPAREGIANSLFKRLEAKPE
jgi:heat shock protein HslJ